MGYLTSKLQKLRHSRRNRRTGVAAWKRSENRLRVERLEDRALLAGFSIADATVNEVGSASASVAAGSGSFTGECYPSARQHISPIRHSAPGWHARIRRQ